MRPSWIEVDLAAVEHNVRELRRRVAPAEVCAVVKADGYGHGDVPVAEAAVAGGATRLAVALVEEGIGLREAGIEVPILVLSEPDAADAAALVAWRLTPTAYRHDFVDALEAAASVEAPLPVHVKYDTGMHRVGADFETAAALAHAVASADTLMLEGLWTHFAVAEEDAEFTKRQLAEFLLLRDHLASEGIDVPLLHAANSAGALTHPEARLDLVRPGIAVYGLRPAPDVAPDLDLRPAMRVVSQVSLLRRLPEGARPSYGRVRPMPAAGNVATIPIGYADGVARRLSVLGGEVLIRGKRHPFAGVVTMDQIVVDVGADEVEVGDEVVLLGSQGSERVSADEWAERLGTINYEIVCGFGPRLPRRYVGRG